jgi:hypothetical protein
MIGDARARAVFTEGSKSLASALWRGLGHATALDIPPELAGADWRAVEWERAGWTADLIEVEARRVGPGKPISYYEKVFATAHAKRGAPLPAVEIIQPQTVKVTANGHRPNSLCASLRRDIEELERDLAEANDPDQKMRVAPIRLISS